MKPLQAENAPVDHHQKAEAKAVTNAEKVAEAAAVVAELEEAAVAVMQANAKAVAAADIQNAAVIQLQRATNVENLKVVEAVTNAVNLHQKEPEVPAVVINAKILIHHLLKGQVTNAVNLLRKEQEARVVVSNAKIQWMVGLKKVLKNRLVAQDQELKEVSTISLLSSLRANCSNRN